MLPHQLQDPQSLPAQVPEVDPGLDAARKQVDRILASDTLRAADALRRLLRFLADKTFSGEADDLKEYSVGMDGVGKPSNYDPRQDAGVRLQASRLRQKLDEYYRGEGSNDCLTIELPKGRFKIVWRPRVGDGPPPATVPPTPPVASIPAQAAPAVEGTSLKRWRSLAIGLAVISLVLACVSAWTVAEGSGTRAAKRAIAGSSPELEALWSPFISSAHHVIIAFTDPLFVRFQPKGSPAIVLRRSYVSRWDDAAKSPEFAVLSRSLGNPPARPSFDFAMRCDLVSAFVLGQFFATRRRDVSVTRLGELSWQQFADDDVILLASRSGIHERQSALPVQPAFIFDDQGIRNLKPLAGEPPVYPCVQDDQDGNGDALELVSVMPGPLGRTKVMSFANNRVWAGPGAVQSLTDPVFARVVVKKLREPSGDLPPFYQIVIRISYRGGTAVDSSYVTHRALTVARSSVESPIAP